MENNLKQIEAVIEQGPYTDTWESLQQYTPPKWYQQTKFGIFIHWGVYSVPAFGNEWYSRNMYRKEATEYQHHINTYGPHIEFGYKDFIPQFTANNFDPEQWASLFKQAGAEYVVPVAEHHDGFQMYNSALSQWNAYQMGPKKDILGELKAAFHKHCLSLGASSHRAENWFFFGHGKDFNSDVKEPLTRGDFYWPAQAERPIHDKFSEPTPTKEFLDDWLVRTCEIIDRYHPKILYFDWWIEHQSFKPYLKKLAAYYYNHAAARNQEVVINYKFDSFMFGTAVVDMERGQFSDIKPFIWQTDTSIANNSWCHTENNVFKQPRDLICDLVDIVSKNGRLLLNVGPKADGSISNEEQHVLKEIGTWLRTNGEAIYGSKVWWTFGEGPTTVAEGHFSDGVSRGFTSRDIRYTVNGNAIYATVLTESNDGTYTFTALSNNNSEERTLFSGIIDSIQLLGSDSPIAWKRNNDGLHITGPLLNTDYPVVFKLITR